MLPFPIALLIGATAEIPDLVCFPKLSLNSVNSFVITSIPPEFRARPYTEAELNPKLQPAPKVAARQEGSVLDKFKKIWKPERAQARPPQPKEAEQHYPRKPMASAFNQAATKPEAMGVPPSPEAQQKPDLK